MQIEEKGLVYKLIFNYFKPMKIQKIDIKDCLVIRQKVLWPKEDITFVKIPGDDQAWHYGMFKEEELICVISLFIHKHHAQFRKFACLPRYQGKGYGSELLRFIILKAQEMNMRSIWCNARADKEVFYQKFGLKSRPNSAFTKKGQQYIIMEKFFND